MEGTVLFVKCEVQAKQPDGLQIVFLFSDGP